MNEFKRMILETFFPNVLYKYRKYDEVERRLNSIRAEMELKKSIITKLNSELTKADEHIVELNEEILNKGKTELEKYCEKHFEEVPKFAYKDKGKFKTTLYSVYPNEFIQPDRFLVDKCRNEIGNKKDYNIYNWIKKVGEYVDNRLKWTSDKETENLLDHYSSPVLSILYPNKDCEDHSFMASSLEPEMGVAFGYCGTGGHAWNVFVYNNELYCLETNSVYDYNNNVKIFKYKDQSRYQIHWIFTKNKTYRTHSKPVHFGKKVRL